MSAGEVKASAEHLAFEVVLLQRQGDRRGAARIDGEVAIVGRQVLPDEGLDRVQLLRLGCARSLRVHPDVRCPSTPARMPSRRGCRFAEPGVAMKIMIRAPAGEQAL